MCTSSSICSILGASKRKSDSEADAQEVLLQKAARLEAASPGGQLHRVTEPSTLGAQVIGAEATPITSIVNTAALSVRTVPHDRISPSLSVSPPPSTTTTTIPAAESDEISAGPTERNPTEFTGYVHKLKKAWMLKSYTSGSIAAAETTLLHSTATNGGDSCNGGSSNGGRSNGSSGSGANSTATSPQLTRATPSPAGSTKSTGSGKGFPSAVRSAPAADIAPLRLNGHQQQHGSPASDRKEEEEDEEDLSSGDEEDTKPPAPKQHRKKPFAAKGKPGPKPKGRPAGTAKPKGGSSAAARRVATKGSESDNFSDSEKESDSSKASSRQSEAGGGAAGKKRGRKPLKAGAKVKSEETGEPRLKKLKVELTSHTTVGGTTKSGDPFARPSISQLKKTGDSFLQDASCFEVAPKLNKCRECRWSQAQRQKQSLANIFCRFYAFRRLRYTKNGQIAQAGFCDPRQDAQAEDLKLWLPSQELSPPDMDKETAKLILRHLSSQFYTIYR